MSRVARDGWQWSDHLGWMAALLLATILQALVAWRSSLVARDGIDFIRYAQNLPSAGRQLLRVQDQHPGYPLLVLGSSVLIRPWAPSETSLWIAAARTPPMLLGLGSVILVWLLARRLFDRWTADLAALIFAALPVFRQNAVDGLSDSPHLFFYLLATWLTCEGLARLSWRWWAGAGAASSIAYWIRPEGLAVACVAGATLLAVAVVRRGQEPRRLILCGAALAGAVVLLALPYPLLSGKLTSKQNPYAQQQPRLPFLINEALRDNSLEPAQIGDPETSDRTSETLSRAAVDQPAPTAAPLLASHQPHLTAKFLGKTLGRALYEFGDEIVRGFRFFFLLFYALGYLELRHRSLDAKLFVFLYALATLHILVLLGVFFMSGYISHRHVMPLIALAMPWIALGIIYTAESMRRLTHLPLPPSALALLLTMISCGVVIPRAVRELHPGFLSALDAAAWIKGHTRPEDRLLSNSKYVSYFAERPTVMLSERTPTIQAALAQAGTECNYKFAVLDLAEEGFQAAWMTELKPSSHRLLQLDALVRGHLCPRVLVLESTPQVAGMRATPAAIPPNSASRASNH